MRERTKAEEKYIRMIEAVIDLGTEFNGCAELQGHYEEEMKRHKDLMLNDKSYSDTFNAYVTAIEKENAFTMQSFKNAHAIDNASNKFTKALHVLKAVGQLATHLPSAYKQRKREETMAELALQPKQ